MSTLSTSSSHEHGCLLLQQRCEDRPKLNQDSSSFSIQAHPDDKILFRTRPRLTSFLNSMLDIGDATDVGVGDDEDNDGDGNMKNSSVCRPIVYRSRPGPEPAASHSSLPNLTLNIGHIGRAQTGTLAHVPGHTGTLLGTQTSLVLESGQHTTSHSDIVAGCCDLVGTSEDLREQYVNLWPPPAVTLTYRSSIRVMVRDSEAAASRRPSSRAEVTSGSTSSGPKSTKCPIVRPAIRLPKDLYEKMPSAPTTPVSGRKEPVLSKLVTNNPSKKVPKTVASMVRRFELEAVSDTKTRAGFKSDSRKDTEDDDDDDEEEEEEISTVGEGADTCPDDTPVSSRTSSMSDTRSLRDSPQDQDQEIKEEGSTVKLTTRSKGSSLNKNNVTSSNNTSVPHGVRSRAAPVVSSASSQSRHQKKSTNPLSSSQMFQSSSSNVNQKKSVHSKSLQSQNPAKNLTSSTTNTTTTPNKKSVDLRGLAAKESQKKSSFVDKEKSTSGKIDDKKDVVSKVNPARKQSLSESKKLTLTQAKTKSGINKPTDGVDNIQTVTRQGPKTENKKEVTTGRTVSKKNVGPRPIEKASSSVSLVRKKFERKIESTERGEHDKKSSKPMPKVRLSENLFLKGEAAATSNAKKKSETDTDNDDHDTLANDNDSEESTNASNCFVDESLSASEVPTESPQTHPSDISSSKRNIHPQPIIHPDCQVNEFETVESSEIEDVPVNVDDGSRHRLVPAQLETELPESPAYRSPLLSDSEPETEMETSSRHHVLEAFVGGDEPSLRNKLLSNLVNKRSESDGIVCLDRPRPEITVRRCESIDNAIDLVDRDIENIPEPPTVHFPQNIKTVTPATIMKGPEDYTAGLQETVYLRTHYFGNPEPRVVWYKGARIVNQSERVKIRTYPGESTLVIRDLRADDSGKYEIAIENEVGSDCCSASLCVEGPPEPPGGRPYITSIDPEALRLTLAWYGSTFDGGSMLTGYIIEMSSWPILSDSDQPEPTDWTIVTSKCHSTSYKVKNLDHEREYIFRIRAQNIHGQSCPGKISEPVSFMKFDDDFADAHEPSNDSDDEEFYAPFKHKIVTLQEGNIFKDTFDIYEELGRGRFGVVFKVSDKDSREVFAAKFVRCRKQEEREKCKEEINIMNGLDHSRLLQLAAAYETPREVIMIMEFIGGGELFEKVVADDFTLTEHDCVLFMRQICQAIGYMHQKDIVHLDLKPENILCKSKKSHQIKIIDFGLTRKLKPGEDVRILFGTPEFVSPEVISYEPVSAASDMWSVGVVCYVLLSGLSPFMGESDVETFANITGLNYDFDDEAFEHISEDAKDFIHKLLVKDQRRRLKALECLKHPWLDHRDTDKRSRKEINTDKLKSFLMRRRWQKAAHAIRALGRFTSLGFRQDSKDTASSIALSTQSADF